MQGFGAIVSFELDDADAAERVCAATRVIVHATSLGGIESSMERRRRHPDEDLTPDGLIRLSVGCEHPDDLWADLSAALEAATGEPTTPKSDDDAASPTSPQTAQR
jgi:cystathionine gamma-synthase